MTPEYRYGFDTYPSLKENAMSQTCWVSVFLSLFILTFTPTAWADRFGQGEPRATRTCPENLSHLHEEMEKILRLVDVPEFIRTMRNSLKASIPDAIRKTDGLLVQIQALKDEIQYQERVEKSAELIARDVSKNFSGTLEPCRRREKGGYCSTVERFFMAKAANLANRGFLDAIYCYQSAGFQ